jgi:type II secretory pathway pseudopilin PulG
VGWRAAGKNRGFSLLETVFVVGLASLLLTVAFRLANSFLRVARTESLRSEIQQSAIISLGRILTDCSMTLPGGISIKESNPVSLAINPYQVGMDGSVVDGAGLVTWSDRYCVYTWDSGSREFLRFEWNPSSPSELNDYASPVRPKRLAPDFLGNLASVARPTRTTRLASQVRFFQILPVGSEKLVRQPLQFVIEIERQAPGRTQPLFFRYARTAFMAGSE